MGKVVKKAKKAAPKCNLSKNGRCGPRYGKTICPAGWCSRWSWCGFSRLHKIRSQGPYNAKKACMKTKKAKKVVKKVIKKIIKKAKKAAKKVAKKHPKKAKKMVKKAKKAAKKVVKKAKRLLRKLSKRLLQNAMSQRT